MGTNKHDGGRDSANGNGKGHSRGRRVKKAQRFISGDFIENPRLRRVFPLVLYCCLLIFLFIAHNFHYQRLQRQEITEQLELNKERSRSIIFASMRMNYSRPSYIMEELERRKIDLHRSEIPPKKIVVTEEELKNYLTE